MSYGQTTHEGTASEASDIDDAESRLDARCALIVFAVTLFGFLLVVSSFDGAVGMPGLL